MTASTQGPVLDWRAEDLWLTLQGEVPGLSIEILPSVGSTNTALLDRIRAGDEAPSMLVAEAQTAGRGRLGRPWFAAPGASLTVSLATRLAPADWSGLSLAVGVAIAEALDPPDHARIGLKWPNDLWLIGRDLKLGGILIETLPGAPGAAARPVVIGVGLNIAATPPEATPKATPKAARQDDPQAAPRYSTGYAGLQGLDPTLDAPRALHRIAPALWRALAVFEREGLAPLLPRYAARDVLAGRRVSAGELAGVALGPAPDGALRLQGDDGRSVEVRSGEVSVRPCR